MEEERSGESARAAREQAKRDRDRESEAMLRKQQSEQQRAELLALRARAEADGAQRTELAARLAEEGARRRALESQLQRLTVEQPLARGLEPETQPRRHPVLWSFAFIGAGAILFLILPRQVASSPPRPVVAESSPIAIEAAATVCPELAPVDPSPPLRPVVAEPAPEARAPAPRRPRRPREKVPPRSGQAPSSLPTDCAGQGPLCGMPKD